MSGIIHRGVTRILNWRPGPVGMSRLRRFAPRPSLLALRSGEPLPTKLSLRPLVTILDQGQYGTCTANSRANARVVAQRVSALWPSGAPAAFATALATVAAQNLLPTIPLSDPSRLFIYWNTEDSEGDPGQDNGATITDTAVADATYGACHETTWTYTDDNFLVQPSPAAYDEGKLFPGCPDLAVDPKVDAIKAALAEGRPVCFGGQLRASFQKHRV